ncbi:hypothetical protein LRQ11_30640, partial [Pseudomonas sp. MAFF 311095]|nr:hypothetical protein [Pseudomonas petroselini]
KAYILAALQESNGVQAAAGGEDRDIRAKLLVSPEEAGHPGRQNRSLIQLGLKMWEGACSR